MPEATGRRCCVEGCDRPAEFEVILYDFYPYHPGEPVFFEQDFTCPYICAQHAIANETYAKGVREPRGFVEYPYTNQHRAQGFTVYRPLRGRRQQQG